MSTYIDMDAKEREARARRNAQSSVQSQSHRGASVSASSSPPPPPQQQPFVAEVHPGQRWTKKSNAAQHSAAHAPAAAAAAAVSPSARSQPAFSTPASSATAAPVAASSQQPTGSAAVAADAGPGNNNNKRGKKKGDRGLNAAAPVFVPTDAVVDFVPTYRPPQQQPYQQVENAMQQQRPAPTPAQQAPPGSMEYLMQQHALHQALQAQAQVPPQVSLQQPHQQQQQPHQQQQQPHPQRDKPNPRNGRANAAQPGPVQPQQHVHAPHADNAMPRAVVRGGRNVNNNKGQANVPEQQPQPPKQRGGRQRQQQQADAASAAAPLSMLAAAAAASSSSGAPSTIGASSSSSAAAKGPSMWRTGHADNSMLAKTITEQLMSNSYDCSICSESIARTARVWSCACCHLILHLTCAKKWHETNRTQNLGDPSFRCPGCMFIHTDPPSQYYCFCGKTVEPDPAPFLTPHACAEICGRALNCRKHFCSLPCHPGHCPKCTLAGPTVPCACGATQHRVKCGDEELSPPTCNNICNKLLNCAEHSCQRTCHNGACDACDVRLDLRCFCGQVEESRLCGQQGTVVDPQDPEKKSFSCTRICNKQLTCGNPNCKCAAVCHAGPCSPCTRQPPSAPDEVQKCACGKMSHTKAEIEEGKQRLAGWGRASCKDALPTCGAKCGRLLNCQWHTCNLPCHDPNEVPCGMLPPASASSSSSSRTAVPSVGCSEVVKRQCRCAAQHIVEVPCVQIRGDSWKGIPPASQLDVRCDTKCRVKLACKKHHCTNVCCPRGESHVCTKVCGRPLDCGQHNCDAFCHLGSCQKCEVVYREGIPCACGRTRTPRNTKCGTAVPLCPHPCSRQRECNPAHKCLQKCHPNNCAPCVVLVKKMCAGGHKELGAIPCYANPSCGVTCHRLLRCGIHTCRRPCHGGKCTVALGSQMGERKGWSISPAQSSAAERKQQEEDEEDDDGAIRSCKQKCGLKRSDCGHPCSAICHPSESCPTDVPCKENVRIYCDCKRISKTVPCSQEGGGVGLRSLQCTSQCEVETRNARFRDALQLDDSVPRIPYPAELLDAVIDQDLFDFVERMERMLGEFVGSASATQTGSKSFPPMPTAQRWVLHQLASYYNLESESFDPEPRRTVRVIKHTMSTLPKMKLSDAIKTYRDAKAGKGGLSTQKVTLSPSTVVHIFDCDLEPKISPSDLALALRPYSLDYNGEKNNNFRVNWLDHSHALIVFHDAQLAANVRANLVQRKLFALEPDELASKKAVDAWRNANHNNGLFRRLAGGASAKKLTAFSDSVPASSSFDEWSAARQSKPKAAEMPATSSSSWDDVDDDLRVALERSKVETSVPSASAGPASSVSSAAAPSSAFASMPASAGSVSFSQPSVVSTNNAWSALGDENEEEDEEDGEQATTRKQRRRAAAAEAAAAAAAAAPAASSDDAPIASEWEELAGAAKKSHRKGSEEVGFSASPPAAKSAFDD